MPTGADETTDTLSRGRYSFDRLQGRLEKLEALLSNDGPPNQGSVSNQFNRQAAGESPVMEKRPIVPTFVANDNNRHSSVRHDSARAVHSPGINMNRDQASEGREQMQRAEDGPGTYMECDSAANEYGQQLPRAQHQQNDSSSAAVMPDEVDELWSLQPVNSTDSARFGHASAITSTKENASCLDFDQTGGQPRYYGPASRLYIHESDQPVEPSTELEVDADFTIDIDSTQIQKQLLFLFWHVEVMPAAVVNEDLFRAGRAAGKRSQYYSNFLQDSLLACASRSSTSSTVRGLGERYIERAKKEIAREIERPNLASLQGFLLLSDFEATQGRDRVGWIYCGTACRLLFDLGLQEDCSNLVKQGRLTPDDAGMRLNGFLVTFIFEKLWKLYLGRPSSVNEASLAAVRDSTKGMIVNPAVDAYVSLCVQVSSVTDFLNTPASSASISDLKARATELDAQIQSCYCDLPANLKNQGLNGSEMEPAAYGINMQFCGIRIVLHRALSRLEGDHQTIAGNQYNTNADVGTSNSIIYDNAVQIAKLIQAYREIFGVDRVATIMLDNIYIAAQALIQHIIWLETRNLPHSTDVQSIRILADTMKDVVPHYPITSRMRSTLARLADTSISMRGMFGDYLGRQPELPEPSVIDDLSLTAGAWGSIDSFWNFDLADPGDMAVDSIFSGS